MILKRVIVGDFDTNCYLVGDSATREIFILDPGSEPEKILEEVSENNFHILDIINTHGHIDHIGANRIRENLDYSIPILAHPNDKSFFSDPEKNLSSLFDLPFISPEPDKFLEEGDEVKVGKYSFMVILTPGHTPGSICLFGEKILFSGDTLFKEGIGRTDFPESSLIDMEISLQKLSTLPDETIVYPGHGEKTTIGQAKRENPFFK